MALTDQPRKVIPAQVGFLAIYNPSLGRTDDTIENQIVYYSTIESNGRIHRHNRHTSQVSKEEKNEQLRQIGLAQGMVEFGRTFSQGSNVNVVETEKSRIILHELESDWWIIASIELTRLPSTANSTNETPKNSGDSTADGVEYSSREVKPAALLLQDLLRAHSVFLLHHAASMSALFVRTRRPKFVTLLGRYWNAYLSTWSVLMHGNPAVNIYGGIKVAACGELGIGVGEEDRGSGEREVLEGFIGRIEGLVDLVVSKFGATETNENDDGNEASTAESQQAAKQSGPWLGSGEEPSAEDGAIFLGVGALSRKSVRDVTYWMEDLYSWGSNAYGVAENPSATRRLRKQKPPEIARKQNPMPEPMLESPEEPEEESTQGQTRKVNGIDDNQEFSDTSPAHKNGKVKSASKLKRLSRSKTWRASASLERQPKLVKQHSSHSSVPTLGSQSRIMSFMKLGYGSHWTLGGGGMSEKQANQSSENGQGENQIASSASEPLESPSPLEQIDPSPIKTEADDSAGHYLIGLIGDVDQNSPSGSDGATQSDASADSNHDRRTMLRTLTVEVERESDVRAEADISVDLRTQRTIEPSTKNGGSDYTGGHASVQGSFESQDRNKTKKLRVVVYVKKPFVYAFFFDQRTPSLALTSLYLSLHHQISPLQRPLLTSTTYRLSRPDITTTAPATGQSTPIYDLIWDPKALTVNCTIPSIPTAAQVATLGSQLPWSRMEALNTQSQILNTFIATRDECNELERTCKTSRGYWVVWNRIPSPEDHTKAPIPPPEDDSDQIISLTQQKAQRFLDGTSEPVGSQGQSNYSAAHPYSEVQDHSHVVPRDKEIFLVRKASDYVPRGHNRFNSGSSESGWGGGSVKLAQGIGVDTKRYIEGLLHLT